MTRLWVGTAVVVLASTSLMAQAPPPPPPTQTVTPKATPTATPAPTAKPTPTATPAPANSGAADPRLAGVPMYPGAAFLQSMDLGNGQWLFVFGTNDLYASAVAFYKGQLGKSTEVSRTPAIQQFDLGSFDSGRMTQRPSVLVKDYTWPDPAGYLHVTGAAEIRYKTLIQIIPATK
jgi:hypothetical protein